MTNHYFICLLFVFSYHLITVTFIHSSDTSVLQDVAHVALVMRLKWEADWKHLQNVSLKSFNFMGIWHINCSFTSNSLRLLWHILAFLLASQPRPLTHTCPVHVLGCLVKSSVSWCTTTSWIFPQAFCQEWQNPVLASQHWTCGVQKPAHSAVHWTAVTSCR